MDLRVGQLSLRARVPGAGDAWRSRIQRLAGAALQSALHGHLEPLLAARGLGPDVEIFVRHLRVRVRVRGRVGDPRLAAAWAEALARDLSRQLDALGDARGGWTEDLALFADPCAAALAWVAQRMTNQPEAWWEARVAAGRRLGEALADVAYAAPARLPSALMTLHQERRLPWESVLTPTDAETIFQLLLRAAQSAEALARGSGALSALGPQGAEPSPGSTALARMISRLSESDTPALVGVEHPSLRRLLAAALALSTPAQALAMPSPPPATLPVENTIYPLYLAGLVLLVRPLLRGPVAAKLPPEQIPALVLSALDAVLRRLLAPLDPALAALVRVQHAELVEVLSGGAQRVDEDLGETALDAVLGDLPREIADVLDRGPLPPERKVLAHLVRANTRAPLAALVLRPGRLEVGRGWADLYLPLATVDLALRLGGWDLDPGWIPSLGRVIRLHYEDSR